MMKSMRSWMDTGRKAARRTFLSGLALSMAAVTAFALVPASLSRAAERYTYTVTLSAGGKGSFSGKSTIKLDGISYSEDRDDRIDLSQYLNQVTLEDEKYYVRGFHLSGQEDLVSSVAKTGDAVYVVSYGIKGNMVKYTVNYQDTDGNEIAPPSEDYYGNVGDKPVVAFLYIEGYQPDAYNLTKTLSEDESKNVFTFTYTPIPEEEEPEPEEEEEEEEPAAAETPAPTTTTTPAAAAPAAAAPAAAAPAAAAPAAADDGADADDTVDLPDEEVPAAEPEDLKDLDDEEVPLANLGNNNDGASKLAGTQDAKLLPFANMPLPVRILLLVVIAGGIGAGAYFIYKKKKLKDGKLDIE